MKAIRLVNRCESHQPRDIAVSLITNRLLTDVSWTKSERKIKGQTSQETKKKRGLIVKKTVKTEGIIGKKEKT